MTSRVKVSTFFKVSSEVTSEEINSTSGWTVAGLKKCIPRTCGPRLVLFAISPIEIEDVLEARMPSFCTISSSVLNTDALTDGDSTTASITRSRSVSSSKFVVKDILLSSPDLSSSVIFSLDTAFSVLTSKFL